jgi:hypothetical protein
VIEEVRIDDVGFATLDVVEGTGLRRLVKLLATLEEGGEPLGVEALGTAGDGVAWDGEVCEVLVVPNGTVGMLAKSVV